MKYIFLISGWCGSGKDMVADYLVSNTKFKYKFCKLNIANELKKYTAKKYNFDYNLTNTQSGKQTLCYLKENNQNITKSVRDLLIEEALLQKTKFGDDFFIQKVSNKIDEIDEIDETYLSKTCILISDFRFIHEYEFMKNKYHDKIKTIRINRFNVAPINSPSETELDNFKFDYTIINNGKKEDVYKQIDEIFFNIL